jgi:hypothetical protein
MTVSMHRVLVALKRPTSAPELLVFARAVVNAMNGNAWFPAPVPSLARVQAAIDRLAVAETAALSMTVGLKKARNEAQTVLVGRLTRLKAYVQGVADDNPDFAAARPWRRWRATSSNCVRTPARRGWTCRRRCRPRPP